MTSIPPGVIPDLRYTGSRINLLQNIDFCCSGATPVTTQVIIYETTVSSVATRASSTYSGTQGIKPPEPRVGRLWKDSATGPRTTCVPFSPATLTYLWTPNTFTDFDNIAAGGQQRIATTAYTVTATNKETVAAGTTTVALAGPVDVEPTECRLNSVMRTPGCGRRLDLRCQRSLPEPGETGERRSLR
jgi:hypothetical protein